MGIALTEYVPNFSFSTNSILNLKEFVQNTK